MFKQRELILAVIFVVGLIPYLAEAHPLSPKIDNMANVFRQTTLDPCVVRIVAESYCVITPHGVSSDIEEHDHSASAYGQVYIHDVGGHPMPGKYFKIKTRYKTLRDREQWVSPPLRVHKTLRDGACAYGNADASGRVST